MQRSVKMSLRKSKQNDVTKPGKAFGENIKCTLVGDERVGKTSMLLAYQTDTYPSQYVATTLDTYSKSVTYNGKCINLQLYDIGGKEKLENFKGNENERIGTDIFLLCFAIDDRESFNNAVSKWYSQVHAYWLSTVGSEYQSKSRNTLKARDSTGEKYEPVTILVGCKSDKSVLREIRKHRPSKRKDPRQSLENSIVTSKEAIEKASKIPSCFYIECCARTGAGIKDIFTKAIHEVLQRKNKSSIKRYV